MQRFRSRGCLTLGGLLAVVALLACGWLYLLPRGQGTPDLMAELKQLPLYPNARAVVFEHPISNDTVISGTTAVWASNSSGTASNNNVIAIARSLSMSLDAPDEPGKVMDFYTRELSMRGWQCQSIQSGANATPHESSCMKVEEGFPQLEFTGFSGPNGGPPWVDIYRPLSWRTANLTAYTPSAGAITTHLMIRYHYVQIQ